MSKSARHLKKGILLLGITSILWGTALLFRFRIVNIFDAYLMKFPGPLVSDEKYGVMATIFVSVKEQGKSAKSGRQTVKVANYPPPGDKDEAEEDAKI